jgi:hypothetical protein
MVTGMATACRRSVLGCNTRSTADTAIAISAAAINNQNVRRELFMMILMEASLDGLVDERYWA